MTQETNELIEYCPELSDEWWCSEEDEDEDRVSAYTIVNGWDRSRWTLLHDEITNEGRWGNHKLSVVRSVVSGDYFAVEWYNPGDFGDYDEREYNCYQVYPHQITTVVYKKEPQS